LTLIISPLDKLILNMPELEKPLQTIKRNAFRLLRMIEQLLDIEKMKVLTIVDKKTIQTKTIISSIACSFEELAEEKDLIFNYENICACILEVAPDALDKIVLNLLSNAFKYTPAGGHVTLSTTIKDNAFIITIKDTGVGIAKEHHNSVFQMFNRIEDHVEIKPLGTGLGLSLVNELVKSHEGRVSITSTPKQGTLIEVELPISIQQDSKALQKHTNKETVDAELKSIDLDLKSKPELNSMIATSERESVLIVEDNQELKSYLVELLSDKYQCYTACDGEDGFKVATSSIPDIIISDIMMPIKDGYQFSKEIRADERTSHIPIILLTAMSNKQSRLKGWMHNIDEYLTKPFDTEELLTRISNLLSIRNILREKMSITSCLTLDEKDRATSSINKRKIHSDNFILLKESTFLNKIHSFFQIHYHESDYAIQELAIELHLSERQLSRKLKGIINQTPAEYLKKYRIHKSSQMLKEGMMVSDVWSESGFSSHSHFSKCFKAHFDLSPSEYRSKHLNK
jgi:DNA-binding response OmpR family regulator